MAHPLRNGDPARIGPYRLHSRLGGGGMGQVFLGRSRGGRWVAVKVVRPELADDPEFRRRFAAEVEAARRVGGFYTAPVVDADTEADPPWLAAAYIPGPSLQAAVTDHGPLPIESVVVLGTGLAEGLTAVHASGLVHRDLKPGNVILAADGPRLIDFGIARALDTTSHTRTSTVLGTAAYMSPEQARAEKVGPPSDVFSLGCVLTFAATGRSPFGEGPLHAVVYRVVHAEPDLSDLPAPLVAPITACLAKDPVERPSPQDLLADLTALAAPEPSHPERRWLPEPVTEIITHRATLLLPRNDTGPATGAANLPTKESRHRPAADQEKQEQPGRVSLVIGNLGPTGLELAVDDAALGTVPAYETRTFPLTPGVHSLLVQSTRHRGVVRRIEAADGATVRMAYDLPRKRGAAPQAVQAVTFTPSWTSRMELMFKGTAVSAIILSAASLLLLGGLMPFMTLVASLVLGILTTLLNMVSSRRLTLNNSGIVFPFSSEANKPVRWDSVGQVSVIEEKRGSVLVLWPRGADHWLEGANSPDGTIRYQIDRLGFVSSEKRRRRFHAALRWFAADAYFEQL
ncbi:MAG TPA: serine/threonine-protein kinase [Thermobifida alba]|nr:serine/threonine-protein kinase [Thermobifida alba]